MQPSSMTRSSRKSSPVVSVSKMISRIDSFRWVRRHSSRIMMGTNWQHITPDASALSRLAGLIPDQFSYNRIDRRARRIEALSGVDDEIGLAALFGVGN